MTASDSVSVLCTVRGCDDGLRLCVSTRSEDAMLMTARDCVSPVAMGARPEDAVLMTASDSVSVL